MQSTPPHCLVRGSINIDEFFHVKHTVKPGETISSTAFEQRAGGKGANQAVAVAKAGGKVDIVGAIGEDGAWIVKRLEDIGVGVQGIATVKEPTGRAVIQLNEEGENCIILYKGANYSSVPPLTSSVLSPITHLLVQNEIPLGTTSDLLRIAHDQGVTTIFNPSPMPPSDSEIVAHDFPWEAIDWLLLNEVELDDFHNLLGDPHNKPFTTKYPLDTIPRGWPNEADILACRKTLMSVVTLTPVSPSTNIICTLGGAGVVAFLPGLPEMLHVPAAKLQGNVKDTTGAGDCFTGYLVAGLMELHTRGINTRQIAEKHMFDILSQCVKAAGMCVEQRGAMESIPARREVDARTS